MTLPRIALVAFVYLLTNVAHAQNSSPPSRLRVFVDCPDFCDQDYLRQNIEFIEYVRDRATSDVHVLVTTQGTGGGGLSWTVKFIGLSYFEGQDRTLTFTTPQTATNDDRRREFARIFRMGLVGYAAETSVSPQLDVTWKKPATVTSTSETDDPWDFWVFRIGANGNTNGEKSRNNRFLNFNLSGSRTTENWKINISGNSNSSRSKFDVGEGQIVTSSTSGWNFSSLVVKSLGAQWSIGANTGMSASSFSNIDRSFSASPGIEYDFFPYSESSRRSLTVQYSIGATTYNYRDETIYDKLEETVPNHAVNSSLGLRAPWGSVGVSANISQHLNHMDRYRISLFGNTDVRLFKGFSFRIFGQYDKIHDQIGLRKGDATTEEVLLRVQQLATGYSYFMNFGINYSFGSIFNTTVNPRFGGGGGGFIFF